ncbi:MAG TPA: type III pantothenate kinase [Gammaproteobacteria bacterium]|nr:type III pantothenate kinase [Gammaproteobacteria bacterium]
MILALDIGNSRVKWAWSGSEPSPDNARSWTPPTLIEVLEQVSGSVPTPGKIFVSNVAGPAVEESLHNWAATRHKGAALQFVRIQANAHGIKNIYPELGVDRFVALAAARRQTRDPLCVIDCGTALTMSVLNADGSWAGGTILPGLGLMRRALAQNTHALTVTAVETGEIWTHRTDEAIAAGTRYAVLGGIETVWRRCQDRLGGALRCWLTGGEAHLLLPHLTMPVTHDPYLILRGLLWIAGGQI